MKKKTVKKIIMSVFKLNTRLGAQLFRENHFNKNGLVAFVALELLDGYVDVSGQEETVADKIMTVNGCLSTPLKWQEFDNEWQAYLKGKGFKPDPKVGRYVFHTASFWANKDELMPKKLTRLNKQNIYRDLIEIICKHALYRFGYGVVLDDYRQVEKEFPHIRESLLGKPGTAMSRLCFKWNSAWAHNNNFNPSISYMFDRGDNFFGELYSDYRRVTKKFGDQDSFVSSLAEGNKAEYSPLQVADIVAWECRRYFLKRLVGGKIGRLTSGIRPSPELRQLNVPDVSDLRLYDKNDLKSHFLELIEKIAEKDNDKEMLIGEGKIFNDTEVSESYSKYISSLVAGEECVFQIQDGDKTYKIFADGKILGFSDDAYIFNKIPFLTHLLPEVFQDRRLLPND